MRTWNPGPLGVALAATGLSLALGTARTDVPPDDPLVGDRRAHGEVVRVASEASTDVLDLRTEGRVVRVRVDSAGTIALGDHVDAWLHLTPITRYANPRPALSWPALRDAPESRARLLAPNAFRVSRRSLRPAAVLARAFEPLRDALRRAQGATLAPRAARLARAMVLGDAHALSDDERAILSRSGLAHLIAVSGLNLVIVVGALVWAFRFLLRRIEPWSAAIDVNRVAAATTIPLGACFAALTGFQPSAIRAAIMAAIAGALVAAGRRSRGAPVLGATVIAALLYDPEAARRPGFLLSVVATAALIRLIRPEAPTAKASRWSVVAAHVRGLVTTNVRATLATAPIILWLFGELPVIGLVANLIGVPATSMILLPLALLQSTLAAASRGAGEIVAPLVNVCSDVFFAGAELAARAPTIALPAWTPTQVVAAAVVTAALLWPRAWVSWRTRALVAMAATVLACASEAGLRWWPRAGTMRVTFLDVGQGDATFVELPDGRTVLVDAGDAYAGERSVVPYLRAHRIDSLDLLVVTHPHPDHHGGVEAVARAVELREIWDTGQAEAEEPDGAWARTLRQLRERGIRVRGPTDVCRTSSFAGVSVVAPCPDRDPDDDANDASYVLRLRHGARSILLTGDIEGRAERRLVRSHADAIRADVLKVAHHGSRTSSSADFLRAVRPIWAVASAGRGNRYRHPHSNVERRFASAGIRLLSTRRCGGVRVETDGTRLDVRPTLPCPTESANNGSR